MAWGVRALQRLHHYPERRGGLGFAHWDDNMAYRHLPNGIGIHEGDLRAEEVNERDDQVVVLHL